MNKPDSPDSKDTTLSALDRRTFIKTAGVAAAAMGGIEGILAARRAPAFAQGTKLHWVRWVDFIPESDVELKRQMPEASKALGAEVRARDINANDLQPRITAAIQSGRGRRHLQLPVQLAPPLPERARRRRATWPSRLGKARGRLLRVYPRLLPGRRQVARRAALDRRQRRRLPASPGSRRSAPPSTPRPGTRRARSSRAQEEGQALRPDPRPHLRRRRRPSPIRMLWAFGGAETDKTGKKVVLNSKGALDSVKFMQAFWKDCCDEGGLAWDDTNNNRAFHAGEISRHPQRRLDLHRGQAAEGQDQGRQGRAAVPGHRPRAAAGGAGRAPTLLFLNHPARGHEVLEEPEARQGLPALAPQEGELRQVVHEPGGLQRGRHQGVGERADVGQARQAAQDVPHRGAEHAPVRLSPARPPPRPPRPSPSTSSPTCTPRPSRA